MMGFPTAFTLMGLGMFFGFIAFYDPAQHWIDNRVFDLMVQRTYGAMTNDVLISIPLFVLMGYVMERGALVDKMFYSIQLAFRRVPASLAVATLIVCTFWGIASRPRRRGRGADGRDRLQPDAAARATTSSSPPASSPPAARSAS
ncbi:MAG: TRAP transporter large permease subunit [Ferruginibacter sp.]